MRLAGARHAAIAYLLPVPNQTRVGSENEVSVDALNGHVLVVEGIGS